MAGSLSGFVWFNLNPVARGIISRHGKRSMNLAEILRRAPEVIDASAAPPGTTVVQYVVSEEIHHVIKEGSVTAVPGRHPNPDVTVTSDDSTLRDLLAGALSPTKAMFTGRLKVKGNMGVAMKVLSLIDRQALAGLLDSTDLA